MKSLVVEDNAVSAMALSEILVELGYGPVSVAEDLHAARLLLRAMGRFDLAFVDIYLGDEADGTVIAGELRALGTPVVYASSYSDEETLALALPTGAEGYVVKPFAHDQVFVAAETAIATVAFRSKLKGDGTGSTVDAVREMIDREYATPLSVAVMARAAGLGEAALIRAFRRTVGTTPHRYLTSVRLDRAAERLLQTNEMVSEVARACGFSNQSHFTKAFRERFGRTPMQHRYYR